MVLDSEKTPISQRGFFHPSNSRAQWCFFILAG